MNENRLQVSIPIRVVNGANAREHWSVRARRAKRERQAAYLLTPRFPLPCVVTLTRVGKRSMDGDGATIAMKHVRDGIADRLGVDDADPRVTWEYRQRTGDYAVEVELKEIEP